MTEPQPAPRRYWIVGEFRVEPTKAFMSDEKGAWIVIDNMAGIMEPDDIVYFCSPGSDGHVDSWGSVFAVNPGDAESEEKSPHPEGDLETAEVSWPSRGALLWQPNLKTISRPVKFSELPQEFSPLRITLLGSFFNFSGLDAAQVKALNSLIRSRGVEAPPDPPPAETPTAEDTDTALNTADDLANEEMAADAKLAEVLGSQTFSGLAETIFRRAIELASERGPARHFLTPSCILFGMAEVGQREEPAPDFEAAIFEADDAAQFLRDWFDQHYREAYSLELRRLLDSGRAAQKAAGGLVLQLDEGEMLMTPSAVRVVETAARIARHVSGTEVIYARHLLGALLLEVMRYEGEVRRRLMSMQADVEDLKTKYYAFIAHPNNDEDDFSRWRGLLFGGAALPGEAAPAPLGSPYLPAIDSDSAAGEDLLDIRDEVEGFANIIAADSVKPPLSIGLFGDWGSGKSFFMSKLKERVAEITRQVRERKGEKTAYLSNIIQIDFNAWHYVEANLWASIVTHVFDNLNLTDEKEEAAEREKAEERKRFLLEHLDTTLKAHTAAVKRVEKKDEELTQAKEALKEKEGELAEKQRQLEAEREAQKETRLTLGALTRQGLWPMVREYLQKDENAKQQLDDAYQQLGLKDAAENLDEAKRQVSSALTVAGRAQVQFNTVVNSRDVRQRIFWLAAVLVVVPLLLPPAFLLLFGWEKLGGYLTWAGEMVALVVGGYTFVKPKVAAALGHASAVLGKLEGANRQLDLLYERAKGERDAKVAAAEKEVEDKRAEVEARRDEVEAKRAEVEEARRQISEMEKQRDDTLASLDELGPARMLAHFIEERASSKDYRQHLGIVALVHQDFKKLSRLMFAQDDKDRLKELREAVRKTFEANNQPPPEDLKEELEKYRIDRIVLYIDDLDRCPPRKVVDVLQAIHLLLAFRLFVVVVGVDARWVRHSLKRHYPGMLVAGEGDKAAAHGAAATPGDYIEKIFQVPFWLRPLGGGSAKLLRGLIPDEQLLKGNGHAEPPAAPATTGGAGDGTPTPTTVSAGGAGTQAVAGAATSGGGAIPAATAQTLTQGGGTPAGGGALGGSALGGSASGGGTPAQTLTGAQGAAQSNGGGEGFSLRPEGLLLEKKEREAMVALSEIIGRTPRTLKRFVNVYRIIRAGLKGKRLEDFKGKTPTDGQFRAVLLLLGVAHGAPDLADDFFARLKNKHAGLSAEEETRYRLIAFLEEMADPERTPPNKVPVGWHATMRELKKFARRSEDVPLGVLRDWAPLVVRYTFQHGHLSDDVA